MTSITIDLKEPTFIDLKKLKIEILNICTKHMQRKNCLSCKKKYNYFLIKARLTGIESYISICTTCNTVYNTVPRFNPFRLKWTMKIIDSYFKDADIEIYSELENKTKELEDFYLKIE